MNIFINDYELNEILVELIETARFYYAFSHSYFEDMYHTGCRSTEPLQIERWSIIDNIAILNTLKTEAIRWIPVRDLSLNLINCIDASHPPYGGLTYDQLTAEFRKYIKIHPIYAGERIADTYLFRYNRAKQIMIETQDLNIVKEFFGWNSLDTANRYVTQKLYFKT